MWSLYLLAPFPLGYLMTFVGEGPFRIHVRMMQLFWAYFIGAALPWSPRVPLMSTWLPSALLLASASLYITGMTIPSAINGNIEARIYIAGQCVAVDVPLRHPQLACLLPRHDVTNSHIGISVFVMSLGVIAAASLHPAVARAPRKRPFAAREGARAAEEEHRDARAQRRANASDRSALASLCSTPCSPASMTTRRSHRGDGKR